MDAVEEVKSRLNIEDVVAEYIELKRAGRNFKGLSPFSGEKTPSFMVSPEKQIWHDFSSGKGGNIFSFVMDMEGLDFKGALDLLARKAGVDLSQYQRGGAERTKHKEKLLEALELATKFYQVQFSRNNKALEYVFKARSFSKETALEFRIGYSPNTGAALSKFLLSKNFSAQEIKSAGLGSHRYGHQSDMFRGRLMIPLMDSVGKVIGFTARLLDDVPNAPKYINTPQTPVYDKGRHIFGLHLAKDSIRKSEYAVVVEGNLDVIASHQAGVRQTVATAGTAITEAHLKGLSRFTHDIRLSFDQDTAGLNATERAIPIASKVGVSLSIINISEGKDPDELIRKDPRLWQQATEQPVYALDWMIERYKKQLDLSSAPGKRTFSDILLKVVRSLNDSVEQDHYLFKLSEIIGVSKEALETKLRTVGNEPKPLKRGRQSSDSHERKVPVELIKAQNKLLALALRLPDLRVVLKPLTGEMMPSENGRALLELLEAHPNFDGKNLPHKDLHKVADYIKMLDLEFEELYQGLELLELHYEAARLQVRLIEYYVKTKKAEIASQLRDEGSASNADELLKKAKALDDLLKISRGGAHG